jgi:hypothetical protein
MMLLKCLTCLSSRRSIALFFIVGSACLQGLLAQTVYKCGNTYSQVPCPNATPVNAEDARAPEQKQQADAITQRELKHAKSLEQARLAQEKAAARTAKAQSKAKTKHQAASDSKPAKAQPEDSKLTKITPKRPAHKATKPEGFVAQVPASAVKPGRSSP